MRQPPRLIHNNDLAFMVAHNVVPPMSKQEWLYELVGRFRGTQIDVLVCNMHGGAGIHPVYPTAVEEAELVLLEEFESVGDWRRQKNYEWVVENDPYPEAIELCHEAGMEFWSGMRFNDLHDHVTVTRFCAGHPEYLLGDKCGAPGFKDSGKPCKGMNYAMPEVRDHVKQMIEDVCARYDLDGFELDFTRHPGIHYPDMAEARPALAEYLSEIRAMLDRIGAKRGRRIGFGCRTYQALETSCDHGLDVETWIKRELFDYINPTILWGSTTESFFKPFVELAKGTQSRIYACTTEHLERRWRSPGRRTTPPEVVRAGALNAWRDGVDGMYTMNWCIPIMCNYPELMPVLSEVGDADSLEFKDKFYTAAIFYGDPNDRDPKPQLPLALDVQPEGPGATIRFTVADDLQTAAQLGILESVTIELSVTESADEKVEFTLNGKRLPGNPRLKYRPPYPEPDSWGLSLVFPLDGPEWIRPGVNELHAVVRHRDPALLDKFTIFTVDLDIRYRALAMRAEY